MKIIVQRIKQGQHSILSELYINDEKICYVLEDSVRDENIKGSTTIPVGRYKLAFRRRGGMHGRYTRMFPDFHQGMMQLMDVPGLPYSYIHTGHNFSDTSGCLLVGNDMLYDEDWNEYEIRQSQPAYISLYKRLAAMVEKGEVLIEIIEGDSFRGS